MVASLGSTGPAPSTRSAWSTATVGSSRGVVTVTTKALRALSRAREDLVGHRVALANELRAQLECFWPGAATVFADVDSPIALAFLRRYPSPADAVGLGEQRMARFLARHHYCGRKPASELLGRLRGAAH